MYLQEQKLSLPAGGGDTLQVLLNSQGSASPFFDPPPSSVSRQVRDLALLFELALSVRCSGQYFASGEERRHSKNPQRSAWRACNTRTDLDVGEPRSEG